MTDPWDQPYDQNDYDDDTDQNKKNPLRDRMRKLEKENKELREANEKHLSQVRRHTIEGLLEKAGYSTKVASLVPAEVEATKEAVDKWLTDWGDVFQVARTDDSGTEGTTETESAEAAEAGRTMGRIAEATQAASTPQGGQDEIARELGSKDLTQERLLELINQQGGGFGSG